MVLFINACVREDSRTRNLAEYLLAKRIAAAKAAGAGDVVAAGDARGAGDAYAADDAIEEVDLTAIEFPAVDEEFLAFRDKMVSAEAFDDPVFRLAKQFAAADDIVIAAPFWDLSFPAVLKQYFEQINVVGITFFYTPEGVPQGLCKAKRITYVMTAGGDYVPEEFGPGYVKALAQGFYGIPEFQLIKATGLDIDGADVDAILAAAREAV